ncbi:hypothetical protein CYMTET_19272 [Cymbomonas tetramitiformis]|uniref:Uncharacterized protein n=1 Tax=Cymbomonas tetramitiformis TaxID=36881 RepID=A0AAE0L547_9CHLO|nr:hypothetical protein CYMTET_19272 [Cymbomonas tetramitiformis]
MPVQREEGAGRRPNAGRRHSRRQCGNTGRQPSPRPRGRHHEGDVDVTAYGFHVEKEPDSDGDNGDKITEKCGVRDGFGMAAGWTAGGAGSRWCLGRGDEPQDDIFDQMVAATFPTEPATYDHMTRIHVPTEEFPGGVELLPISAGYGSMNINNDDNSVTQDPVMCIGATCIYSGVDTLSLEIRLQVIRPFVVAGGDGAEAADLMVSLWTGTGRMAVCSPRVFLDFLDVCRFGGD